MKKFLPVLAIFLAFLTGCANTSTGIINVHEHIQSLENVEKLLKANKEAGIKKTLLMGSPKETILYDGSKGFSEYDANNKVILEVAEKYPNDFAAFCTLYWGDPDQLSKLKSCMFNGGTGIKLYNGHGFFYEVSLLDEGMQKVYKYAEQQQIPILFHVNGGKFLEEFEEVLKKYPNLKVICPHFCLLSSKLKILEPFLDRHPNVYIDISFGYIDFMKAGFSRISHNKEKYQKFFTKYQDRIVFGTDTVVTNAKFKDEEWLAYMFESYKNLLESKEFELKATQPKKVDEKYNGLELPQEILDKIYYKNYEEFVGG